MALDFIAGCLGGFSGTIASHPFDTIKVRLQGQDSLQKKYTSTWNCFAQIVKNESVFGLYKGLWSPLYGQIFTNAIIFGVYGNVLRQLHEDNAKTQFIAGAAAGGAQSIVCSPMELIKVRLQMQVEGKSDATLKTNRYKYTNTKDCILKIYKHENGIRGLFRGLHITLWREVPAFGVYFSSYYYLCNKTGAIDINGDTKLFRLLFCGGMTGILSWISTYPLDVIKTRIQADGLGKELYNGIIDCTIKSYKQEGITGFFHGFNATLVRAFPCNAATLATVTLFTNCFIKSDAIR